MIATHDPNVPVLIASALQKRGTNCTDLDVATVMQDAELEHDVLILYKLDRWTTQAPPQTIASKTAWRMAQR